MVSNVVSWTVRQYLAESVEARSPSDFELVEQTVHIADAGDLAAHELLATTPVLGHESGLSEYGDVLLNRGKAHRVEPSEVGHRALLAKRLDHDGAAGGVGESVEQPVGVPAVPHKIYNHLVVD